jgi:hypothetical protein
MTARPAPGAEPVPPDVVRTLGSVVLALIAARACAPPAGPSPGC